ncbi:MAG: pro-sigmaK processing inhibitor BofA family protein [Clostridia bacterium]|nr:pro-sigmaK processing inhibitor BofA family protein [Clostridia bacterium]
MAIELSVLFAYVIGIIILFLLGRMCIYPMKILVKLLYNAIIGGIVLLFINLIGGVFNYHIALNVVSALIVGFLGIPGIILLVVFKVIFSI